jgi:glycosyltransferase involved in cell wall biosynthesis
MIVSICVVTYNSEKTVLDTLNSILMQSYSSKKIDLIIGDDYSKDSTVNIIDLWLNDNKNCFNRVFFIKHPENKGVANNINSVWKATQTEWIKGIAGDDILHLDCISKNLLFINNNKEVNVVLSKCEFFYNEIGDIEKQSHNKSHFFELDAKHQFKFLQKDSISGTPSLFIKRELLQSVGWADIRFPMMEDYPIYFKITKAGYKIYYNDELTVYYRVSDSISNSITRLANVNYLYQINDIERLLVIPSLDKWNIILKLRKRYGMLAIIRVVNFFNNKKNFMSLLCFYITFSIWPGFLIKKMRKLCVILKNI